jgi:hypothetical protein
MAAKITTGAASRPPASDMAAAEAPGLPPEHALVHVNEDVDPAIAAHLSDAGLRFVPVSALESDRTSPCVIVWGDPARALTAAFEQGQPPTQALDAWNARGRVLLDIHARGGCVLIDQDALSKGGAGWERLRALPAFRDLRTGPGADARPGQVMRQVLVQMALMQSPDARQTLERLQAASGAVPGATSALDLAGHGLGALHTLEAEMDALHTQSAQAEATHRKSMAEAEELLAQALHDLREEAAMRQALEMSRRAWLASRFGDALASIRWRIAQARRRLAGQKRPIPMGKTEENPHDDRR